MVEAFLLLLFPLQEMLHCRCFFGRIVAHEIVQQTFGSSVSLGNNRDGSGDREAMSWSCPSMAQLVFCCLLDSFFPFTGDPELH